MMRGAICAAALLLGGCAGLDAAAQYSDVSFVRHMNARDNWRVFDKPDEGRLMITASVGRAFGIGVGSGLTFGAAGDLPKPEYQDAAEQWLASTGRACTISDGYVLVRPQWEFKYRCN